MVPNLYVEITCQLHCFLDSLFVVGAFHNVGSPQKVTTATNGVDAIWYRHDKFPELALGGCNGQPMWLPGGSWNLGGFERALDENIVCLIGTDSECSLRAGRAAN
jgi:hypothetical protein